MTAPIKTRDWPDVFTAKPISIRPIGPSAVARIKPRQDVCEHHRYPQHCVWCAGARVEKAEAEAIKAKAEAIKKQANLPSEITP